MMTSILGRYMPSSVQCQLSMNVLWKEYFPFTLQGHNNLIISQWFHCSYYNVSWDLWSVCIDLSSSIENNLNACTTVCDLVLSKFPAEESETVGAGKSYCHTNINHSPLSMIKRSFKHDVLARLPRSLMLATGVVTLDYKLRRTGTYGVAMFASFSVSPYRFVCTQKYCFWTWQLLELCTRRPWTWFYSLSPEMGGSWSSLGLLLHRMSGYTCQCLHTQIHSST